MITMQLEDAYKFSHAATLGPPCPQLSQQTLIDQRPTLPPTTDGLGVVESARALFQQRQIMQRIENVLLLLVASRVAGNDTVQAKDVNDPNTFKVRKAKVGGYRDYFDDGQVAELEEMVNSRLLPAFGYTAAEARVAV